MLRRDTHINTIHYYKNVLFFLLTFSFYVILSPFHGTTHKMTIHNLFFNELPFWGIWLNSFSYFFVCCCYHHFGSFTCSLIHSFPFFLSVSSLRSYCFGNNFFVAVVYVCCVCDQLTCLSMVFMLVYVCVCACVRIYVWVYVFICVFLLLIAQWINFFNFNSSGYSNIPHTRTHAHTQYKCKCNFNLFIIFYFICNFGYRLIQFAINLFIFSFVDFHPLHSN